MWEKPRQQLLKRWNLDKQEKQQKKNSIDNPLVMENFLNKWAAYPARLYIHFRFNWCIYLEQCGFHLFFLWVLLLLWAIQTLRLLRTFFHYSKQASHSTLIYQPVHLLPEMIVVMEALASE